ncbi:MULTISPECIES: hypothetical protein [Glutamicibacter]|uniref:hypothetical protein n=1 Tax=Glutamicibacter TaxID=1742989 RepID=UPI00167F3311|nr:hypothetical protein [Glutamicibacter nicotianae]
MSELVLRTLVDGQDAQRILAAKAPGLAVTSAKLRHHPFAGFVFEVPQLAGRIAQAHALVDYYSGKAFATDPWQVQDAQAGQRMDLVADPKWNTIDFDSARERAKALLSTAALRRARLAWRGGIREKSSIAKVWKPNWVIEAKLEGKSYRIMVDGLNGGYFFIGS